MSNRQRRFSTHLKGKTIVKVDAVAVNSITLTFSDGTSVELETEFFGAGIYGMVLHAHGQ